MNINQQKLKQTIFSGIVFKSFEDELLDIFILIEENTANSTEKAIEKYQKLYKRETFKSINKSVANAEMRKEYNAFIKN